MMDLLSGLFAAKPANSETIAFARKQNFETPSLRCLEQYCCLEFMRTFCTGDIKQVGWNTISIRIWVFA